MAKPPRKSSVTETVTPAAGLSRTKVPSSGVGKSARVVSASLFADMLAISRGTVTKWIRDGMPNEGEPPPGKPHQIDVGLAVRWLQRKAVEDAEESGGGREPSGEADDGGESYEMAKTRKERALANVAESDAAIKAIKEAEARGSVSPNALALDAVRQDYASLGSSLLRVGHQVETKFAKARPERIGKEVTRLIQQALDDNLRYDVDAVRAEIEELGDEAE